MNGNLRKIDNIHLEESESIDKIQLGVLSDEEVYNMSVCIIEPNMKGSDMIFHPNMGFNGAKGPMKICPTCNQNYKNCPGHFGCIELVHRVFNPIFFKHVGKYLKIFCHDCKKLLLEDSLTSFPDLNSEENFKDIIDLSLKINKCFSCKHQNASVHSDTKEHRIFFESKGKKKKSPERIFTIYLKM